MLDRCINRRGEGALGVPGRGADLRLPVYYYQGRVREQMKIAGFTESYRQYVTIRGASREDLLLPDIRRTRSGR